MARSVVSRFARDQWVRLHGTPRVTVLVGGERGRTLWQQWLALSKLTGTLLDGPFDERIRDAVARAESDPEHPIAVLVGPDEAARWRDGRRDRLAAMVDEGWTPIADVSAAAIATTEVGSPVAQLVAGEQVGRAEPAPRAEPVVNLDARSVAEATLFEALQATRSTTGRFKLNESLSVRFGGQAAEVDLLSRGDQIAIEIDGYHHFSDLDCYRRDRRKDLLLQTQGYLVVRLLAEDVMRDVQAAVNTVVQAVAYRLGDRAP